ncbi:hypothetical protein EI011_24390, partial [Escherichia coli]|uniref:hypothetical protein n=1 Tax=Escherichia coli TaxID=562 RepID=UPI00128F6E9C
MNTNNIHLLGNRAIWTNCQGNDSLAYVNGNGRNVNNVQGPDEDSDLGSISGSQLSEPLEKEEELGQGGR